MAPSCSCCSRSWCGAICSSSTPGCSASSSSPWSCSCPWASAASTGRRCSALWRRRAGGAAPMSAMLELKHVSRRFGGLVAVNNVSFELRAGEIVGLIGPNGAGKTTLVNLITGVHRPSGGEIRYRDERIDRLPANRIACRGIARTFQVVQPFPRMTVLDNVAGGALFAGGVSDDPRGQGQGHGALAIHRPCRARRPTCRGAHPRQSQAAGIGQEPRDQPAAVAARRGQCRPQQRRDRCRAGIDPGHRRARHHHPADRACDEGCAQGDVTRVSCCTTAS